MLQEQEEKEEKLEQFNPPTSCKELTKNLSGALNIAYINTFCIARPIGNSNPAARRFMVGLYPLHFVVNMSTLVFERYFSDTDIITIRGQIFHFNDVIIMALLTGLANLILFIVFYYPNFFLAIAAKSMEKQKTYKVAEANGRIERQVKCKTQNTIDINLNI